MHVVHAVVSAPQDGFVHTGGFTRDVSFVDICLREFALFGGIQCSLAC